MAVDFKVTSHVAEVRQGLDRALDAALTAIGLAAETNAKQEITEAVYNTPPSPTYKRTGRLRNSISNKPVPEEKSVYIGTNVDYALFVEAGTSKMPPRPYLRPAATEYGDQYKKIAENYMKNA